MNVRKERTTRMTEAMAESGMSLHTISIYVANKPGVLARIAQVFARRGFNIESLVVSPSKNGAFSRMTVTMIGQPEGLEQIMRQTGKLVDVIHITEHSGDDAVVRELALVKVAVASSEERTEVLQISEHFGCKTVDFTPTSMIIMATGSTDKVDACTRLLRQYAMVELIRTGKVVMARGAEVT